ncbi:HRDC domain-containing protein, partial [Streptomyces sp. NPDC059082]|uniref:HRDC domain-containing protein n=1 Tax=Streptomyces sp. NPDC059082 TaxID=3346720 RepID=UPI0036A1DEAF
GSRGGKGARVRVDLPGAGVQGVVALRAWRAATAREQGVPAYVVFHDATLREIATRMPATVEELGTVGGVGEAKLTKYAEGVLDALAQTGGTDAPAAPETPATPSGPTGARASAPTSSDEEPPWDMDELEPPWDEEE